MDNFSSCLDATLDRNRASPQIWESPQSDQIAPLVNAIFVSIFLIIGFPSNLLIINSILKKKLYREPTHILLLNLAVSDLLLCVLVMPFTIIAGIAREFVFGSSDFIRCKVCQASVVLSALTIFSLHILSVISLDRFLFIKMSLRYDQYVTAGRTITVVALVWALSIALSLPPLFGLGDIDYTKSISTCTPKFQHSTHLTKNIYYMVMLVLEALVPISVLLFTNLWTIYIAQRNILLIYKVTNTKKLWKICKDKVMQRMNTTKKKKQLRLVAVFGTILIANVITWIPLIIRSFWALAYGFDNLTAASYVFVFLCLISHSFLHPLIEASLIPEIRDYNMSFLHKLFIVCSNKLPLKLPVISWLWHQNYEYWVLHLYACWYSFWNKGSCQPVWSIVPDPS